MELLKKLFKRVEIFFTGVPIKIHNKVLMEKEVIIKEKDRELNILRREVAALERKVSVLEKEVEYNARERLIDHEFIATLLAHTPIPTKEIKELERRVAEEKLLLIKNYGR